MLQEQSSSELHPLWRKVTALNGQVFYFNPFTGRISQNAFPAPPSVPGGILSDEVAPAIELELFSPCCQHVSAHQKCVLYSNAEHSCTKQTTSTIPLTSVRGRVGEGGGVAQQVYAMHKVGFAVTQFFLLHLLNNPQPHSMLDSHVEHKTFTYDALQ